MPVGRQLFLRWVFPPFPNRAFKGDSRLRAAFLAKWGRVAPKRRQGSPPGKTPGHECPRLSGRLLGGVFLPPQNCPPGERPPARGEVLPPLGLFPLPKGTPRAFGLDALA